MATPRNARLLPLLALLALPLAAQQTVNLSTSKQLMEPVPGAPRPLNSLPMAMAWSPDHKTLAIVNSGFGTAESNYQQSIALLDAGSGELFDNPEKRTPVGAQQTLYSGLAWSRDGKHLYASLDSLSAPEGGSSTTTGNAIAVYAVDGARLTPERLIPIPLQHLAAWHTQNQIGKPEPAGVAIPVPTGLATLTSPSGVEEILVADDYSDDVLLLDAATGKVLMRFDLAANAIVPSTYPIAVIVSKDGRRAWVALWNGSAVAALDLVAGKVTGRLPLLPPARPTDPSSHPTALALSPDGSRLYVALANRDAVAAVALGKGSMSLLGTWSTELPGQTYPGSTPDALALSPDGSELYVTNSATNSIAVLSTAARLSPRTPNHAQGFLPTEWYPTAVEVDSGKLYVATAKGVGTGPNAAPQAVPRDPASVPKRMLRPHAYIATLLHGSLATIDLAQAHRDLPTLTAAVVASNRMAAAQQHIAFTGAGGGTGRIKHVIYIIKENRTYDQVFGDLGVGHGDPSLTMYGKAVTPNLHKLAVQFGVLDNFYDSGEVSGDGHVWSNAAINSDYNEKIWQQSYRGRERQYDFEGVVEQGYPLLEGISDIDEPGSSYLWTDLARHGKSLYHFGEFISTKFCDDSGEAPKDPSPMAGTPEPPPVHCARAAVRHGEQIPEVYGGGASPYPWDIPLVSKDVATKPELVGHFDPDYPDFNLKFPDQLRVNVFLRHLDQWKRDRAAGHDTMPAFVMLRLPNDHTAGTTPGSPTPNASVADNDLAVGRAVEAVSHSAFWDDTAFFILEDDAQDGADHVDAHRSISLVVSKYSPRASAPFVDHTFYTTVSTVRTMEDLLGIPPMNLNDAFAPLMVPLFTGAGDQPAFNADATNRDNGLIYMANSAKAPGAKESSRMDFTHEDRADARKLNVILWRDAMGSKPVPQMVLHPHGTRKDDD